MMTQSSSNSEITVTTPSDKKLPSWFWYVCAGIFGNALAWGGAIAYLTLTPLTYTSEWSITIMEDKNKAPNVSLPGTGSASAPLITTPTYKGDPRSDYVYLFTRPQILETAAKRLNIPVNEFKEPNITRPQNSALMLFTTTGSTPEEAQQKSQVFYEVISESINNLRETEINRQDKKTQEELQFARERFNQAQQKLADYLANSLFRSNEQLAGLSANIESLRMQQIGLAAQEKALNNKVAQLSQDVEIPQNNLDTYTLQGDKVYQEYFTKYGTVSSKFTELSSQLGSQHPIVLDAKSDLDATVAVLQQRASLVLGRSVSLQELVNLSTAYLDPQTGIIRGQFFQNLATNRVEKEAITAQKEELERQIINLESRLRIMVEEQRVVNQLQLDIELAKAILTSASAKLELGTQDNIYAFYPPFELIVPPNLPKEEEPTAPKKKIGLLAGIAGSFLITTGLVVLWWEKQNYERTSNTYAQMVMLKDME
jgi:uncharacterized protein involved in exopolysaccharide biosynthesis